MGEMILQNCGPFALPQLAISVLIMTLLVGYLVALKRGEIGPGRVPWTRTVEPLGSISTALGLLGSVVGFVVAFGGFANGMDVQQLTRGLATAYWTTGVGIFSALLASSGSYILTVINSREPAL